MNGKELHVFDAPMCCSTGVCGPEVDPALVRFAADLDWLAGLGVLVRRYNPTQDPEAFWRDAAVLDALRQFGSASLPLVRYGGETLASGTYPDRDTLRRALGLSSTENAGGVA